MKPADRDRSFLFAFARWVIYISNGDRCRSRVVRWRIGAQIKAIASETTHKKQADGGDQGRHQKVVRALFNPDRRTDRLVLSVPLARQQNAKLARSAPLLGVGSYA